ncbi:MAG TPA: MFS transporter, partial [Cyclobacteriaceae bacterium]|nr:MFS transporter [Cyclobacteriaceae bacterium]
IDLKLFRIPSFSASLLIYTLSTFVMFGTFIFTFQYMQLVAGLSPIKAGLWSLPSFFAFVIGSMLTPMFTRYIHPVYVMASGFFLAVVGFGLLTQVSVDSGITFLVIGTFIYCLGISPVFTLTTDIIVSAAPPEKAGVASAISETGSEFGGALGIAVQGTIGTGIYRIQMNSSIPAGVPGHIEEASKETLSGALLHAGQLPPQLKSSLTDVANEAFVSGMQSALIVCGVVVLVLAILCLTRLRPPASNTPVEAMI